MRSLSAEIDSNKIGGNSGDGFLTEKKPHSQQPRIPGILCFDLGFKDVAQAAAKEEIGWCVDGGGRDWISFLFPRDAHMSLRQIFIFFSAWKRRRAGGVARPFISRGQGAR